MVFSTKNKYPFLNKKIRKEVFEHIRMNAKMKDIWLDCVNGYSDHAHCLISLGKDQTISKVAQLIKGESSFWINRNNMIPDKFSWQDDYWAASLSESHLQQTRNYIYGQEEHHQKKTFKEELDVYMIKHGFQLIKG
jgi:REP element-mobilizing transposase RayT